MKYSPNDFTDTVILTTPDGKWASSYTYNPRTEPYNSHARAFLMEKLKLDYWRGILEIAAKHFSGDKLWLEKKELEEMNKFDLVDYHHNCLEDYHYGDKRRW